MDADEIYAYSELRVRTPPGYRLRSHGCVKWDHASRGPEYRFSAWMDETLFDFGMKWSVFPRSILVAIDKGEQG
jgi:hypothetical protein